MNHIDDDLIDLFPELLVYPVLSIPKNCVLPQELTSQLSVAPLTTVLASNSPAFSTEVIHLICSDEELCAKKKSVNLFVFAFQLLGKSSIASSLWLHANDNSQVADPKLQNESIVLSEPIQLYLSQAGFQITAVSAPQTIGKDFNLFASRDSAKTREGSLKLVG
jgi:hypothetical protein